MFVSKPLCWMNVTSIFIFCCGWPSVGITAAEEPSSNARTNGRPVYHGSDLGARLDPGTGSVLFKLFAPSATDVKVLLFDRHDQNRELGSKSLRKGNQGVWEVVFDPRDTHSSDRPLASLDGCFYQYEVEVRGKRARVLDPYARSMASFRGGSNGDVVGKAAIVNLDDRSQAGSITPGFSNGKIMSSRTDMIAYEIHVRDFTVGDGRIDPARRGTFLGFIRRIPHLKELGVTHVQLMPVNAFYGADEKIRHYQDKDSKNPNYSWGYDPHGFFSLDGWYASDPDDPYSRIREFRALVNKLHEAGIGVVIDIVYNHTARLDLLERIEPGYYHRKKGGTTPVSDPALESRNPMVRKLILDSMKHWVTQYGVDGFRLDLMAFLDNTTLRQARKDLGNEILLYGEAWNYTDLSPLEAPIKGILESYPNEIELATFNDMARNSYMGRIGVGGFVQGQLSSCPRVKSCVMGGLVGFENGGTFADIERTNDAIFAVHPAQVVQYVSSHDGLTIWDNINLTVSADERGRAQLAKQVAALLFTSQGRIFIDGGSEIARTKPAIREDPTFDRTVTSELVNEDPDLKSIRHFHENSYRSSDYTNMIRWGRKDNPTIKGLFEYYRGLIRMRRAIPAFRYSTPEMIRSGLRFIGEAPFEKLKPPVFSRFSQMESLIVKFVNAPKGSNYYLAGEIHGANPNPADVNPFKVAFNEKGEGAVRFEKGQIRRFLLAGCGTPECLDIRLVKTMGGWDGPPGAYFPMEYNSISPAAVGPDRTVTIDLGIPCHSPRGDERPQRPFIAYSLDNTLDPSALVASKMRYKKLIVVHNVSPNSLALKVDDLTQPERWRVILDGNSAGVEPILFSRTDVKISSNQIVVPPHSSAVIASE